MAKKKTTPKAKAPAKAKAKAPAKAKAKAPAKAKAKAPEEKIVNGVYPYANFSDKQFTIPETGKKVLGSELPPYVQINLTK